MHHRAVRRTGGGHRQEGSRTQRAVPLRIGQEVQAVPSREGRSRGASGTAEGAGGAGGGGGAARGGAGVDGNDGRAAARGTREPAPDASAVEAFGGRTAQRAAL